MTPTGLLSCPRTDSRGVFAAYGSEERHIAGAQNSFEELCAAGSLAAKTCAAFAFALLGAFMQLGLPKLFTVVDWNSIPETEHPGETGTAYWKTLQSDGVRLRMVRYTAGYAADHWCKRGHALLVLSGVLETELEAGETITLGEGQMYVVDDEASSHRSRTAQGVTLFIVD